MNKRFFVGRKLVGEISGDTIYKEVKYSKHRFKKFDAWGLDSKMLHDVPADTKIVIRDIEHGKNYHSTVKAYFDNEQYYHFKLPSEDYQTQLFLPLSKFKVE